MSVLKQLRNQKVVSKGFCFCCSCRRMKVIGSNVVRVKAYAGGKDKIAYICKSCLSDIVSNRKTSYNTSNANENGKYLQGNAREKRFQIRFKANLTEEQIAFLVVNYDIRATRSKKENDLYSCVSPWFDCNGLNRIEKSLRKQGIEFNSLVVYGKIKGFKIREKELLKGCKVFNNSIIKIENPKSLIYGYNLIGSYLNFQEQEYLKENKYNNTYNKYLNNTLTRIVAKQ